MNDAEIGPGGSAADAMGKAAPTPAVPEDNTKDGCEQALEQLYAFLDHELDQGSARVIREHLAACEPCVDTYDLELMVKSLIRRSCGGEIAPPELRSRIIVSLTSVRREVF